MAIRSLLIRSAHSGIVMFGMPETYPPKQANPPVLSEKKCDDDWNDGSY
jgi:hypothetical protein